MFAETRIDYCYNPSRNRLDARRMANSSDAQKAFAANLTYWLNKEGRKQSWLADSLGVDRAVITRWKTGRAMPSKSIYYDQLAQLMGLPSTACLFMENGVADPEGALRKLLKDIGVDP